MKKIGLNYEKKIWGSQEASLLVFNGYYLTLKYALYSLRQVRGKILDVGCSAGAFTSAIKYYRPDLEVVGMDISRECIRLAKQKRRGIEFFCRNIEDTKFNDSEFDAVLTNHVFEHLDNPAGAAAEIHRVLKPGGIFYSATPLEGNWSSLVRWFSVNTSFRKNRIEYLGHEQTFSKNEYLQILESTGFINQKIFWSGFASYQIIDTVFYPVLELLGVKPDFLIESEVFSSPHKWLRFIYYLGKIPLNVIHNLESVLLSKFPGYVIHVKSIKI